MPFKISPAEVELFAGDVQAFTVEGTTKGIVWSAKTVGEIDRHGVYVAPQEVTRTRTVYVIAQTDDGSEFNTATVTVSNSPNRIAFLGWYGIIAAVLLSGALLLFWNILSRPTRQAMVVVNPPIVTLDPKKDEEFVFTATVLGDPKNVVTWSSSDGDTGNPKINSIGAYRVKQAAITEPKTVTIRATSVSDPSVSGTAVVHLVPDRHLEILPQGSSAFTSQQIPFRASGGDKDRDVVWSASRSELVKISESGMVTVNGAISQTEPVQITAMSKGSPIIQAATTVIVNAPFGRIGSINVELLLFVMVMGALGSMLYYATSFVTYVGNRTFKASWSWFYIFRPVVGGILAVVFFFIAGSGLIGGTEITDLMKVAMISALVGLFSDKAVNKLSDILDVLLSSKAKEDRADKLSADAKTNPKEKESTKTALQLRATPATLTKGQATSVTISGTGFTAKSKVQVNGRDKATTNLTGTALTLDLTATETAGDKVTITITNEDQSTATLELKVQP